MHDTDMAGILYFARQFRFVHDALEDMVEEQGLPFDYLFHESDYVFVIVHCEADYYAHLRVGDALEVHISLERVGNTSFTMFYQIFKEADQSLVGTAKTVHVTLDSKTRQKVSIPDILREKLVKHLI